MVKLSSTSVSDPLLKTTPSESNQKLAPGELTNIVTKGAFWNIGLAFANKIFTLAGQLVLAWLLTPKDMGLAGMATAMMGIVFFMNASGVCDVLIQRGRFKEDGPQGFWLSLFLSFSTSGLIMVMVPLAVWAGHRELANMLLVLAFFPIADAMSPVLSAVLKTDLDFKQFALCNFYSGLAYTFSAVTLAFMGMGAYSLIFPVIPRALINWLFMLPKTGFPPIRKPDFKIIKNLLKPSLAVSFTGFLNALQQQAPVFMVGLVTDFTVTGHFSWGWQVAGQAVFLLSTNLRQVLMPTLSKISHDPDRQAGAAFRAIRAITALLVIACGLQALLAPPLLIHFFPVKWHPAGPVITWLSLGLAFQGVYVCLSSWLNASGKYRDLLMVTILPVVLGSGFAYLGAEINKAEGAAIGSAIGIFTSSILSLTRLPFATLKEQGLRFVFPFMITAATWSFLYHIELMDFSFGHCLLFSALYLCISSLAWWSWSRGMFSIFWSNLLTKTHRTIGAIDIVENKAEIKPNFFIIGAPKCGTTALSEYLRTHPHVFLTTPKEPKYFDFDLAYPIEWTEESYLSLYSKADPEIHKAIGEASVTYLLSNCAVPEILKMNLEAKFIVMLRNPVDLVRSWHAQQLFSGQENIKDFETAWRAERQRRMGQMIPFSCWEVKTLIYSDFGKLGEQMERLFSIVDRKNVKIIIFEDFISNTKNVYEDVLRFLELPSDERIAFPKVNENKKVRILWLQQFISYISNYVLVGKGKLQVAGKKYGFLQGLLLANSVSAFRPPISEKFKKELTEFFRDDLMKLEGLLGRNFDDWIFDK